eukprot:2130487-Amphidinium_carterae.1
MEVATGYSHQPFRNSIKVRHGVCGPKGLRVQDEVAHCIGIRVHQHHHIACEVGVGHWGFSVCAAHVLGGDVQSLLRVVLAKTSMQSFDHEHEG